MPETGSAKSALSTKRDELERLCAEYAATGGEQLKARIVAEHQWLVAICARHMQRRKEPFEDLVQVANIGLLQAIDRFDPSFGVTFRTFASATVIGVLRRHYRTTWRMWVPRHVQELHLAVSRAIETLTVRLQRSPSVAEVAGHIQVTEEAVLEAMDAAANFWPRSLTYSDDRSVPPAQSDQLENAEQRVDLAALLATLPLQQQRAIFLRFFEERTQSEIAAELGMSQVQVSRTLRAALVRLRAAVHDRDAAPAVTAQGAKAPI